MLKKNNIGKIATIGFGATLLGATAFGLGAAGLADFPEPFASGNNFVIAYGEYSKPTDTQGAEQIWRAFNALAGGSSGALPNQFSPSSDSFLVQKDVSEYPELANFGVLSKSAESLGGTAGGFTDDITKNYLSLLADGDFDGKTYVQSVSLGATGLVNYSKQSSVDGAEEVLGTFLEYDTSDAILTYKLNFRGASIKSSVETDGTLKDFVDEDITILGKGYTIIDAKTGTEANNIAFTLASSAESVVAQESSTVTIGGKSVQVGRILKDGVGVHLTVDGQEERASTGETVEFGDDFSLVVRSIDIFESGGGSIKLDYSADIVELGSTIAGDVTNNVDVEIDGDSETINADFTVTSTVTGTVSSGDATLSLSGFQIVFDSPDNIHIPISHGLQTANSEGEGYLQAGARSLLGDLNIVYGGLSSEENQSILFDHKDGGKQYNLHFNDGDGNRVEVPLVYSDNEGEDTTVFKLGSKNNALVIANDGLIAEDDYFLISDSSGKKTYLLKLESAKYKDGVGTFVIKNVGSGQTFEPIESGALETGSTNTNVGNFFINKAFSVDAKLDSSGNPVLVLDGTQSTVYLSNGQTLVITPSSDIAVAPTGNNVVSRSVEVELQTTDDDFYDTVKPEEVKVTFSGKVVLGASSTGTGENLKLDLTTPDPDNKLLENPGNTELLTGYSSFGTFVAVDSSSDNGKVITLDTPDKQVRPLVYVQGGSAGASSVSSVGGTNSVTTAINVERIVDNYSEHNVILVGGPCVNSVSAKVLDSPGGHGEWDKCVSGFEKDSAIIQYVPFTNGNVALVVAGYSAADTTKAVEVLSQAVSTRNEGLTGTKVIVSSDDSGSGVVVSPAQ